MKIQSRAGYFALPNAALGGTRPFEAPLLKALDAPLTNDVPFRTAIFHVGQTPEGNTNYLVLEVPLNTIEFREDMNTRLVSFHISLVARIKDKAGNIIESFSEDLPRHGALEAEEQYRGEVSTLQRHFAADPGEYTLEAVVQDRTTGKIGAQRSNFVVGKDAAAPALSDVVLVRKTETLKAAESSDELLQFDGARIVPDLSARVTADRKETQFFFLVFPAAQKPAATLELEILSVDGESLGRAPLHLRPNADGKPLAYEVGVHSAFPPGNYMAKAILSQGAEKVEKTVAFVAEGSVANARQPGAVEVADASIPRAAKQLEIAPTTHAANRPFSESLDALLEGAKLRATEYIHSLPDFSCVELTDRSADPTGTGVFHHRDNLAELVRFHDNFEKRVLLKVNNADTDQDRSSLLGTLTHGEFGGMLNAVFSPTSKAEFQWKETDLLNDDPVQVFEYRVKLENSSFSITASNSQMLKVGFRGLVYLDETTRAVRRLTMEATDIPEDFPTRFAVFSLDYDYVAIGDHDFLMPSSGSVKVGTGKKMVVLNEFEFKNYHKLGAESTIRFDQ